MNRSHDNLFIGKSGRTTGMGFTIMHLSDLHRSDADPISNIELVSALVSDRVHQAGENPAIPAPDAIIVSGDLVQGLPIGSPHYPKKLREQYEEAEDLLVRLANKFLGGDRSRLIVVPGNHG